MVHQAKLRHRPRSGSPWTGAGLIVLALTVSAQPRPARAQPGVAEDDSVTRGEEEDSPEGGPGAAPDEVDARAKARALKLYDDGARAFAQKRYFDAIELFLQADKIVKNPAFAFNTALAYQAVGDTTRALRWAREFRRRAPASKRIARMESLIRRLEVRLAEKGLQQLTVFSTPSKATISVDGEVRGVTPWTGELVPGAHRIGLRRPGYRDLEREVTVEASRAVDVELTLQASPVPPRAPAPSRENTVTPSRRVKPPPDEDSPDPSPSLLPWSIAAGALGLAGVGVGIGLEVLRANAEDDARQAATQVEAFDDFQRMEDLQLGARLGVGIGAGFLLVGATLLTVGLALPEEADSAAEASFRCFGHGCATDLRLRF